MDPSQRRVFDKYVQANPKLKAHVERLQHTRQLLCACSEEPKQKAPDRVCARVREKVECDMLRTPRSLQEAVRERPIAAFASTLVVALVVGMFTGAALFAPEVMPTPVAQETQSGPAAPYERAVQQQTVTRSNAGPASFHPLTEYDAGMTYTTDSMASRAPAWRATFAQP